MRRMIKVFGLADNAQRPVWRRWMRRLYHPLLFMLLFLGGLLLYSVIVGFPSPLVRALEDTLNRKGWDLTLGGVRWEPGGGWVIEQVTFYGGFRDVSPLLRAERLRLQWARSTRAPHRLRLHYIEAEGLSLIQTTGESSVGLTDRMTLTNGSLVVRWPHPNEVRIDGFRGALNGMRFFLHGRVTWPGDTTGGVQWAEALTTRMTYDYLTRASGSHALEWEDLTSLQVDGASDLRAYVDVPLDRPAEGWLTLNGSAEALSFRGLPFDRVQVSALWSNRLCRLRDVRFESAGRAFAGRADWPLQPSAGPMWITATNSLPPRYWNHLLPGAYSRWLTDRGLYPENRLEGYLQVGPVPVDRWASRFEGAITAADGRWKQSVWTNLAFTFKRTATELRIDELSVEAGTEERKGPLRGSVVFDQAKGSYEGHIQTELYPMDLLSVYPEPVARHFRSLHCSGVPPLFHARFGGRTVPPHRVWFAGECRLENGSFRGADVLLMDSGLSYSNQVFRLDPLVVQREEGAAGGSVALDFSNLWVDVAVTGNINPKAVSRVIGPSAERTFDEFTFNGPAFTRFNGRMGLESYDPSDLEVRFEGEQVAFRGYQCDTLRFDLDMQSNRVEITELSALLYGGRGYGHAVCFVYPGRQPTRYAAQCRWENIGLQQLLTVVEQEEEKSFSGLVHGQLNAAGLMGSEWSESMHGQLRLSVTEGELFKLSLLGGLSRYLSKLYPGLGYLSQSEFEGRWEIDNGRIYTEAAQILGPSLSVRAKGKVLFDGTLDFRVRVQLLKRGPVADLLRFLTFPVTKLFEFRLRGTVDEPVWRPENLPKELFLMFD